jgi:DnaK suppressor protein
MAEKKITKKLSRKAQKRVAKKSPQKSKIKGVQKKKETKIKALKKVKVPKRVKKVKTPKKVKAPKKAKATQKVKVPKKVNAPQKVKISPKVNVTKKAKTQKSVTKVPITKKAEEERKSSLRSSLIRKREEIVREAKAEISKYIRGETRQLVDTALDNGDWSVVDLTEDISLRQLSTHRETLLKIDEAIRKIREGTYGKCEDCGEDISVERLKILPFAIYCIDCQEKREQFEELERGKRRID